MECPLCKKGAEWLVSQGEGMACTNAPAMLKSVCTELMPQLKKAAGNGDQACVLAGLCPATRFSQEDENEKPTKEGFSQMEKTNNKGFICLSKCCIIRAAAPKLAGMGCLGAAGAGAAGCEIAGVGPEDPLADMCAVAIDSAIGYLCSQAATLTANAIISKCGC